MSFPTMKKASEILKKIKVYAKGGFNITKFTCNKAEVLKAIPEDHIKKNL